MILLILNFENAITNYNKIIKNWAQNLFIIAIQKFWMILIEIENQHRGLA